MVLVTEPKRTPPLHEKKRHGTHHRPSKQYTKTYWPYLTMLAVLTFVCVGNSLWTPARRVLGYTSDLSASALLQRSNIARSSNGEQPLVSSDKLTAAAQAKANDMAARNYWSHITPEGELPRHFVENAGYTYTAVGENLAYGFDGSDATINAWLTSTEHRANALGKTYKDIGFGIAEAASFQGEANTTIIVALYASPAIDADNNGIAAAAANDDRLSTPPLKTISRVETVSTTYATTIAIVSALIAAAAAMFLTLKHGNVLRKVLIHGEVFIVRHHLLDLSFLIVGGVGFILTRNAGVIH